MEYLDQYDVEFADPNSLAVVLKATKAVIQDMSTFPTGVFLSKWSNRKAQLLFLRHALQLTPEIFTMNQFMTRKVVPDQQMQSGSQQRPSGLNAAAAVSPWNCMALTELLVHLCGDPEYGVLSREILEIGVQQSPDFLLLCLAEMHANESPSISGLASTLVLISIAGHPRSHIILPRVCQIAPDLFIDGLCLLFSQEPNSISRILDMCQELKVF